MDIRNYGLLEDADTFDFIEIKKIVKLVL